MAGTVNRLETIDDSTMVLWREKESLKILQAITYIGAIFCGQGVDVRNPLRAVVARHGNGLIGVSI